MLDSSLLCEMAYLVMAQCPPNQTLSEIGVRRYVPETVLAEIALFARQPCDAQFSECVDVDGIKLQKGLNTASSLSISGQCSGFVIIVRILR